MDQPTPVLLTVIVDRSRWLRGEGEQRSRLLRLEDDKMCCLGFACLAAGHTREEIANVPTPMALSDKLGRVNKAVLMPNYSSIALGDVMTANDVSGYEEGEREAYITKELALLGIAMTFVDGPVAL